MSVWDEKPPNKPCPEPGCDRMMKYGLVPCPDGRGGCGVAHYGYRCELSDREHEMERRVKKIERRLEEIDERFNNGR